MDGGLILATTRTVVWWLPCLRTEDGVRPEERFGEAEVSEVSSCAEFARLLVASEAALLEERFARLRSRLEYPRRREELSSRLDGLSDSVVLLFSWAAAAVSCLSFV